MGALLEIDSFYAEIRKGQGQHQILKVSAGKPVTETIVPPAGERWAFTRTTRPTNIEVCVSPTGRSVQVFINGQKVAQ